MQSKGISIGHGLLSVIQKSCLKRITNQKIQASLLFETSCKQKCDKSVTKESVYPLYETGEQGKVKQSDMIDADTKKYTGLLYFGK